MTPSAALWFRAASASRSASTRSVVVAGPGLRHATQEVAEVARLHPGATTLTASEATAERVLQALATSDLVHVAAHGTFRSDNPLFSSIRMVDGPVTVYDIERVGHSPQDMVLSACSAGESTVSSGDELMGLSSALLSLGTRTLVASLLPVPDEITRRLMVELHRALLRGLGPAAALAHAQALIEAENDERGVSTTAFICLGAG